MVLSTPRTLGSTPRRPGDRLVSVWLAASLLLTLAATANAQSANSRHARLSQDLAQLVKTNGDFKPTTVIITASQAKVDHLAAKYGLGSGGPAGAGACSGEQRTWSAPRSRP